jgi:uncharacterized membrane protein
MSVFFDMVSVIIIKKIENKSIRQIIGRKKAKRAVSFTSVYSEIVGV